MLPIPNLYSESTTVTAIPNPILWIRADAATASTNTDQRNTVSSAGKISRMFDFSGNGYHFTPDTVRGTTQATWISNSQNSLSTFRLSNTDYRYINTSNPAVNSDKEIFIVTKPISASSSTLWLENIFDHQPTFQVMRFETSDWQGSTFGYFEVAEGRSGSYQPVIATASNDWQILRGRGSASSFGNNASGQVNQNSMFGAASVIAKVPSGDDMLIGAGAGVGNFQNFELAEIMFYNRYLTTVEQTAVYDYLKSKWNISF